MKVSTEELFTKARTQNGWFADAAARAVGLDCGPMNGLDTAKVDEEFWAGTQVETNFICNLGHGDPAKVMPRNPRLSFEGACRIA